MITCKIDCEHGTLAAAGAAELIQLSYEQVVIIFLCGGLLRIIIVILEEEQK